MNQDRLVALACEGDPRAQAEVCRWLLADLWTFFRRRRSKAITELIQKTMVDVWAKAAAEAPRTADGFRTWVLRFANTEAMTDRRDRAREYERQLKLARMPAPVTPTSPSAKILRRQRQQLFKRHVRRLPTKYRELLLHEITGGTIKQYAAMRGLLTRTARKHRKKAIQMVRQALPPAEAESSSSSAVSP